jgi:hypothetical protein
VAQQLLRSINVWRGICGATVAGMAASVIPLVIPLMLLTIGHDTTRELGYDLRAEPWRLADAMVASAAFFACAGWVTYAPAGAFRFIQGLAVIFLFSVGVWVVTSLCGLAPVHYKSIPDVEYYPRLAAFILAPPVVATVVITWMRARVVSQQHAEPSDGADGG